MDHPACRSFRRSIRAALPHTSTRSPRNDVTVSVCHVLSRDHTPPSAVATAGQGPLHDSTGYLYSHAVDLGLRCHGNAHLHKVSVVNRVHVHCDNTRTSSSSADDCIMLSYKNAHKYNTDSYRKQIARQHPSNGMRIHAGVAEIFSTRRFHPYGLGHDRKVTSHVNWS